MRTPRKAVAGLLAAAGTVALSIGLGSTPASAAVTYTQLVNEGSGLCMGLNLEDGVQVNGARIQQQICDRSGSKLWARIPLANSRFYLINWASSKCLDVTDGRPTHRVPLQQWYCTDTPGMKSGYYVPSLPSTGLRSDIGRCADVAAGSLEPGATIQTDTCTGRGAYNPAQRWGLIGRGSRPL